MAKKVILKDLNNIEVLPITRGELILDSSGNPALHSTLFLATDSLPGLMSSEDKYKLDHLEDSGPGANNKVAQINTTTNDVYRLLFSETADDTDRTEKSRKSANLTFNPNTGVLNLTGTINANGGTLSGVLSLNYLNANFPSFISQINNRAVENSGGWAVNMYSMVDSNDNPLARIGAYGENNALGYIYIGAYTYNGDNLRVYPDKVTFGNNQIAYLTSNVASAQALVNAKGYIYAKTYDTDKIVVLGEVATQNGYKTYIDGTSITLRYGTNNATGMILNSSGNITIGSSDLASTNYKLVVNGNAYLNGSVSITNGNAFNIKDVNGNLIDVVYLYYNDIHFASGANAKEYTTYLNGNNIKFRYGKSAALGLIFNSYGNMTIGGSDLATNTYRLYVNGSSFSKSVKIGGPQVTDDSKNIEFLASDYSVRARISYNGNTSDGLWHFDSAYAHMAMATRSGIYLGIGTTTPSAKLHVAGNILATGGFLKDGSSNNYILLGGGGHKLLSDFGTGGPYLPLTGGTMSGNIALPNDKFIIDGSSSSILGVQSSNNYLLVGSNNYITQLRGSALQYNGKTIWHSGNLTPTEILTQLKTVDGSGSGLDADTVDGYDSTAIFTFEGTKYTDGASTLWDSFGSVVYGEALPDGLTGVYNYGQAISFGGSNAKFDIYVSHVSTDASRDATNGGIYVRSGWKTDKKSWRKLAFMDSNVSSASKLQTARKIWGLNFDGSKDVNGHFYTNGNIYLNTGSEGIYLYPYGIQLHNSNHLWTKDLMAFDSNGNVGIGKTSPAHKLDVNGAISTNNNIYAAAIELAMPTPFIDFHFNNSTADYTSRIIEESSGELTCKGKWKVGGSLTASSNLSVAGSSTLKSLSATSGSFSGQITSTVADDTAPLVVSSATKVTNLNADKLDGHDASAFPLLNGIKSGTWNWNDVLRAGYYKILAGTITNHPSGIYQYGMAAVLTTENHADGENRELLLYYPHNQTNSIAIWGRMHNSSTQGNGWGPWWGIPNTEGVKQIIGTYYWANVPVSSTSSITTTPTFANTTIKGGTNAGLAIYTSGDYGRIRFNNASNSNNATIHYFGTAYEGYSFVKDTLNLTGNGGITIGAWNNPTVFVTQNTNTSDTSGKVGIGTTRPEAKLDVVGIIRSSASGRFLRLGPQNNSHAHYETNADISHWFNKMVEINGICRPYANNSFSSGDSTKRWSNVYSFLGNFASDVTLISPSGDSPKLRFVRGGSVGDSGGLWDWLMYSSAGHFYLQADLGTNSWTTPFFINTTLNVGIGTTSPTLKLHVVGSVAATTSIIGGCGNTRSLHAGGGGTYAWIDSRDTSNNVKNNIILYDDRTSTKTLTPHGNNTYSLGTSSLRWSNVYSVLGNFTGSVTFANGTWNVVGDDAAIGDYNAAGMLGLKSINNNIPGIGFHNSSNTLLGRLQANGSNLLWNDNKIWHAGNDGSNSGLDADLLDGLHESSFLRYRDLGSNGGATLWSQIGIRSYHNALPEGLSGIYNYGEVVSFPGNGSRLDIFTNHLGSSESGDLGGLWWRSGWNDDKRTWRRIIDSGNIANLSVNHANSAGTATKAVLILVYQHTSNDVDYPLIWTNASNSNSVFLDLLYKSYNHLMYNPKYQVLKTGSLLVGSTIKMYTGDAALAIYSGRITDAKSDGNICFLTSIDNTDPQSHTYPTLHGSRCNISLLPRGGLVYIGTNPDGGNTSYKLYVAGNTYASGSLYAAHFYENSDILLKLNIQEILNSDKMPTIKEFDWKEDGSHSYGLIAQELEEQGYSELVSTKDDGYKTVNYSAALSLIVGKLQVKIKELEKEIEILKSK